METSDAVRKNFEEKASYLARLMPGMSVIEQESFLLVDSGVASDTFNVLVARTLSDPAPLIRNGVDYFLQKRLPMALWYWEDTIDAADLRTLLDYGLTTNEIDVAMVADLEEANLQVTLPTELTIKLVENPEELQEFANVLVRLFGNSAEAQGVAAYFQQLRHFAAEQFPDMRYYIGLYQNQVVATGTLFVGSETIGIYDIVTDERFRRKGIGSAMFAHLLNEAGRWGRRYAVLQASSDGIGIYARAGFRAAGNVHVFENRSAGCENDGAQCRPRLDRDADAAFRQWAAIA
ncbi:MAG: GNAT family N-acetyltransferase [Caldilineaceae bacterium]